MGLGSTSGRPKPERTYNSVQVYQYSGQEESTVRIIFQSEDEDGRNRFIGADLDRVEIELQGETAMLDMISSLAECVSRHRERTVTRQRTARWEADRPNALNTPPESSPQGERLSTRRTGKNKT